MDELAEFFEQAERSKEEYDWKLRDLALSLLDNTSQRGDVDLEHELHELEISPIRWREIFTQLRMNELRPFDRGNWSATDMVRFYKRTRD